MNTDVCDRCFDAIYKHYMNSIEISDIKTMRGSVRGKMIHLTTNHEVRIRPLDDGSSIPVTHICPIEV
ncbi:MAG: hypothetical protein KAS32_28910, partial [Candidatus Peribacteraceae bacterium]|nr:hypothetical protein [Candidatus Peribacteraceae bacterium]